MEPSKHCRHRLWLAGLVLLLIFLKPSAEARADIPQFDFHPEQQGDHVWLHAWTQYHDTVDPWIPPCTFQISRHLSRGGAVVLFEGDLGSADVECEPVEADMVSCTRTCRAYVDPCPGSGEHTYTLERLFADPTPGHLAEGVTHDVTVSETSARCELPSGDLDGAVVGPIVDSGVGCGCQAPGGKSTAHLLVLLLFLCAAWLARRLGSLQPPRS